MRRGWPAVSVLGAAAVLLGTGAWHLATTAASQALPSADRVVVVGVPGLAWADVDVDATPQLSALAGRTALGSLTTRGTTSLTCPRDGWVTLGAGNRARYPDSVPGCGDAPVSAAVVAAANAQSGFEAEAGLLGDQVSCTRTFGRDAQLAVVGAPDVLTSGLGRRSPASWQAAWSDCPLVLVAGPDDLRRVDALVGRVAAAVRAEPDTLLVVVGVSDSPDGTPALRVAMAAAADGSDDAARVLLSPSTGRAPYVQLIDVAPTILAALGRDPPTSMLGRPMVTVPDDAEAGQAVSSLVAAAAEANGSRIAALPLIWAWIVVTAAFCLVGAVALRSAESGAVRWLRPTGVLMAAIPVGSLLANLAPWQRTDTVTVWGGVALLAATLLVSGVALAGPWRTARLGPHIAVTVVGALVLGLDVTTGSHLQLNAVIGYSPVVAGRFTGFGNMPYAVFATCGLGALAAATAGRSTRTTILLLAVGGLTMVFTVGTPGLGADFGGVLALVPAVLLTAMVAAGARLSPARALAALGAGVITVTALAIGDYSRAPQSQTHLGRFVGQVVDGSAWTIVERKAQANVNLLLNSPVALLAPVLLLVSWWLFRRPESAGRRLLATTGTAGRAALVGAGTAAVLGSLVNDSGVAVLVAAGAVGVPLLLSAAVDPTSDESPVRLRSHDGTCARRRGQRGRRAAHGDPPSTRAGAAAADPAQQRLAPVRRHPLGQPGTG